MPTRILVVEDDPDLQSVLRRSFEDEELEVRVAGTGAAALAEANREPRPDLFVIDIGLPDADGRDVCLALRAAGQLAPVLFLTAHDAVTDRLAGFGAGGDDYLTKPFAIEELLARIRALLKRAGVDGASALGRARLDPAAHALVQDDVRIELTPTEFRILATLAAAPGSAVRRTDLVRAAWPDGAIVHDNTLDVYISRVRRKLAQLPGAPGVETVHGVGYRVT
jgi:two-component system response regulator MprA